MIFNFDIISDLNLPAGEKINWEDKATSLYCLISGNISEDVPTVQSTLKTLSGFYQGVFYIDGSLDHITVTRRKDRQEEITKICEKIKNVVYLYDNVVVVDGVALVGINGWYGNYIPENTMSEIELMVANHEDTSYLMSTISKLQLHIDVRKIVILSSSVPSNKLFYGEIPKTYSNFTLEDCIAKDTEKKVSHWVFGSTEKIVDTVFGDINYVNNPKFTRNPYYPKRIEVIY